MDLAPASDPAAPSESAESAARPVRPVGPVAVVASVASWLALAAFALSAVLLVVPVEVPGVQDCGAPGAYLREGRVDRIPDAEDRILTSSGEVKTVEAEVADEARQDPCRERVARRAVPAALLILGATIVGMVAFSLELFVVRPRRRRLLLAEGSPAEA